MVDQDVQALAHEYCSEGLPVQYAEYANSDHSQAGLQFFPAGMQFLSERFTGAPFSGNCAQIPEGSSLAPLKVRKKHKHDHRWHPHHSHHSHH
jgi:hypothetical protein